MSATPHAAAGHFVAKWHAREPEMALAEPFCPVPLRPRFRAWGALLHELREALFELSDPRVTAVKGPWWAEELAGLAAARARHPLTLSLAAAGDAPWQPLARALAEAMVAADDGRPGDTRQAIAALVPLGSAVAAVERALFGAAADEGAAVALAVHWLLHRLPGGLAAPDQARIPLHLMARHGLDAVALAGGHGGLLVRDWAGELGAALPAMPSPVLFRRLRTGFDRARLARLAAGRGFGPPPAPVSVWRAWRLARMA